jgi:hypothetical protein
MRFGGCRTNDKWRNLFRFDVHDPILVLDFAFYTYESFVYDHDGVVGVHIRHYDHIGMAGLILQS